MKVLIAGLILATTTGAVAGVATSPAPSYIQAAAPAAVATETAKVERELFERPPTRISRTAARVAPAVVKKKPVAVKKPAAVAKKPAAKPVKKAAVAPRVVAGILPSAYTGPWYDARFEGTRRCIVKRESRGNYSVMNSGGYSGAYQFGQAWTKTIQKWTGEYVPIRYMSRAAQDYAFWRAFNHGKGRSNWNYPPHQCW